jgi:NADPH2:quinone reductase
VGTAALQLARAMGARTIGTSRTAEKVDEAMGLGLDAGVVASADRDWQEGVLRSSGGRGADVILDLVGGSYVGGNLNVLATKGRWIVVGVPGGRSGEIDLRKLMGKRAVVKGTVLRARAEEEKATLAREFERTVVPLFERGHLHPVMDRAYRPEEAAEAHRQMEANRSFGKLMLVWGD